ncbi:AaceriABR034Wp [[Ashbya] aceris (nom. inval.)]|nr:AaceriABR034Wp [[Ashbya] aceris (nom. inval.)]
MAKRFAGSQITRETYEQGASDSEGEMGSGPKLASASTMQKRKIAMPKRKTSSASGGASFGNAFAFVKSAGTAPAAAEAAPASASAPAGDQQAKLQALNMQFYEKVMHAVREDPFVNLTPALEKYKKYLSSIGVLSVGMEEEREGKYATVIKHDVGMACAGGAKQADEVDSDAMSEDEAKPVKVEGPKFTVAQEPTTKNPVFSFGAKKQQRKDDSDSEDEIEVKGPTFTVSGNVSSGIFKLNKDSTESKTEQSAPILNTKSVEKSSGTAATAFGSAGAHESGANGTAPTKPVFTFGVPSDKKPEATKPSFSFGFSAAPQTDKTEKPEKTEKPVFSFGVSANLQNDKDDKPRFTFGTKAEKNVENNNKPTFGATTGDAKQGEAPKSAFQFGTGAANSATSPFGVKLPVDDQSKQQSKPLSFSFGSSTASLAPSFSFGGKPSDASQKPASDFKFSLPFAQDSKTLTTENIEQKGTEEATVAQEGTDDKVETGEPASDGIKMTNGEENEEVLFCEKAKLLIFDSDTKGYTSRGVGELKLLRKKDDKGKVRILCRSEGMGHVLLNTSVVKSFKYQPIDSDNENLVKWPVITDGKLETFIIKVKQKADGRRLVGAVADAQQAM